MFFKMMWEKNIIKWEKCFSPFILSFFYSDFKNLPSVSPKLGNVWYSNLQRGISFLLGKKCFKPSFSPSSTVFSKTFPFWIVKTQVCLVLKLTREVSISSSAKKTKKTYNLDMPVWSE